MRILHTHTSLFLKTGIQARPCGAFPKTEKNPYVTYLLFAEQLYSPSLEFQRANSIIEDTNAETKVK